MDILSLKKEICKLLFNLEYEEIERLLKQYGNVKDLHEKIFSHRDDIITTHNLKELVIYASIMEWVVDTLDEGLLKDLLKKIDELDADLLLKCHHLYAQYENRMTDLDKVIDDISVSKEDLITIKNILKKVVHKKPRRIAIFTDLHALFPPALAILEDIRKRGITEIYSLGDNIGVGPNPSEVLALLDEYHVKSVKGNHELYTMIGVEPFRRHLVAVHSYDKAFLSNQRTIGRLTKEELEAIKNLPSEITIDIGGKKILLTHYHHDYNTEERKKLPEGISHIYQGHMHFPSKASYITTLKAVGLANNYGMATYHILTEEEDGYREEIINVPFDLEQMKKDIDESDLNSLDIERVKRWSGINR